MLKKKEHIAQVQNEYGCFLGIVTMEDLLEAIVGNIRDEYDEDDDEPKKSKGGLIAIGVIIGLLVISILGFAFMYFFNDSYLGLTSHKRFCTSRHSFLISLLKSRKKAKFAQNKGIIPFHMILY